MFNTNRKSTMPSQPKPLTVAVAAAMVVLQGAASAQDMQSIPQPEASAQVIVTGIRASKEKSISAKRYADNVVDVVSAEDIGKMPDKNVADAIQRLPGVTIAAGAGGGNGFDEADRVSMRGTNPNLSLTLLNGHSIATADWDFGSIQGAGVGRSVSFSLLPSELVSQVVVHKSSSADLVEGGASGTVNIITRKPLEFKAPLTLESTVQAVYADQPQRTDPQLSALINWKNETGTFGMLAQAFSETRHLRRDTLQLNWGTLSPTSNAAKADSRLANVAYVTQTSVENWQQKRERRGGVVDFQTKPNSDLTLNLNILSSTLKTPYTFSDLIGNVNNSFALGGIPLSTGFSPDGKTLTSVVFPAVKGNVGAPVIDYAQYAQPNAQAKTAATTFEAAYRVSDVLTFTGNIGRTTARGYSDQLQYDSQLPTGALSYSLQGIARGSDVGFGSANLATPSAMQQGPGVANKTVATKDQEDFTQIDGRYSLETGPFSELKFGLRFANHSRDAQRPLFGTVFTNGNTAATAPLPVWDGGLQPSNFGSGLGGNLQTGPVWSLDSAQLASWVRTNVGAADPARLNAWRGPFQMSEDTRAAYLMGSFNEGRWAGNVGVRAVRTNSHSSSGRQASNCPGSSTILKDSAQGDYCLIATPNDYTDILPSLNIRYELSREMLIRGALSKTMARPDFGAVGLGISTLNDNLHTGSGGNPMLKPSRARNAETSWEWYFAPRSMVSVGAFYTDLTSLIDQGNVVQSLLDVTASNLSGKSVYADYQITSPFNTRGKVRGIELNYEKPLGSGLGIQANYTFADGQKLDGSNLPGNSKTVYNLSAYFENDRLNARVAYTYRSEFLTGLTSSGSRYQDGVGTVAASASYKINDTLSLSVEAMNINNPRLSYYTVNRDRPTSFYSNGRQIYFGARLKY